MKQEKQDPFLTCVRVCVCYSCSTHFVFISLEYHFIYRAFKNSNNAVQYHKNQNVKIQIQELKSLNNKRQNKK